MKSRVIGLVAILALLAVVAGVPWLLLRWGADLIPDRLSSVAVLDALLRPDDGTLALGVITALGWLAWIVIAVSVAVELVAMLRGITAPRLPGLALPQWGAHRLIAAAALLFITATLATVAGSVGAPPAAAAPQTPTAETAATTPDLKPATTADPERSVPTSAGHGVTTRSHLVRSGDTLWALAERYLGDGKRYRELVTLNSNVLDGRPNFLRPGMRLRIPAEPDQTGPARTVVVERGDTLSGIAERELGDADRYPAIVRASRHITQPDGHHLTDPDVIDVGWQLTIPAVDQGNPARTDRPGRRATQPDHRPRSARPSHPRHTGSRATAQPTTPPRPSASSASAGPTGSASPTSSASGSAQASDAPTNHDEAGATTDTGWVAPGWLLTGLTGGGLILAGGLLLTLRRRRRSQWRSRRPGRLVAAPDPGLAPVEKSVVAAGEPTAPTVDWLDDVLRRLGAARAASGTAMPQLVAAQLDATGLTLHLAEPDDLGAPWRATTDQATWKLPAAVHPDLLGAQVRDQPPPWPLLVTVGSDQDGSIWLLNCEHGAEVNLAGDPVYAQDMARYIAAELACNPWSQDVHVDCIGLAAEVAPMSPDRIFAHPAGALAEVVADLTAEATTAIERADEVDCDLPTARSQQLGADAWPARLLLLDAGNQPAGALHELLTLGRRHPRRTGTAVILSNAAPSRRDGIALELTRDGRLAAPGLGLNLTAVGLTADEAAGCAALLAQADDDTSTPMPRRADTAGWRQYADEAGALRDELTRPRRATDLSPDHAHPLAPRTDAGAKPATSGSRPNAQPVGSSMLPGLDEEYQQVAATTAEDLAVLAPTVPAPTRTKIDQSDPTLDADLEAWFSDGCTVPRLTLLGPVEVRAHGRAITKRKAFYTELVAYLHTRPHGATPDEVADAFGITAARVRNDIKIVRDWIGHNPRTARLHLPDARESAAAKARGIGVYQIDGVLTDADLFRRLRVRGQARGTDGIADLRTALTLITGKPLDQLRPGGWTWMYEGDRLDQHLLCAVIDVAHIAVSHSLHAGDVSAAREAVAAALLAGPDEEITKLDLAAVTEAEGRITEAQVLIAREVCNRSDDGGPPIELPTRTQQILTSHKDWSSRREAS